MESAPKAHNSRATTQKHSKHCFQETVMSDNFFFNPRIVISITWGLVSLLMMTYFLPKCRNTMVEDVIFKDDLQ